MTERKAFLLRIDPEVLDAVQRWANDDLRSLNAQIEFVLRKVLQEGQEGAGCGTRDAGRSDGRGVRRRRAHAANAAHRRLTAV